MEEASIIAKIVQFGLSRQEAVIYICLLKNGELTGYEAGKLTGISRSNVYNALAALVEHGAAYLMEGASSKYVAVPLGEFCENRIRSLSRIKEELERRGPKPSRTSGGYITIEGRQHVMDKLHHMLLEAGQRIYFSAEAVFLEQWKEELLELVRRGIKIVLLTEREPQGFSLEGITVYRKEAEQEDWEERCRQIRLIVDSAYVLTGEMDGETSATCLYSAQKNFVNVFKEAMGNEIRLIELSGMEKK